MKIGKDEDICLAGNVAFALDLMHRDFGNDGGIELELAIASDVGTLLVHHLYSLPHNLNRVVLGRPVSRKREHGHTWLPTQKHAYRVGRGDGNAGELRSVRLRGNGAICQTKHAVFPTFKAGDIGDTH